MTIEQIWLQYGPDIILGAATVIGYFLVFLFKRMVKNTKENCILALTNKEETLTKDNKNVLRELGEVRKENAELKAEMARIKQAILHVSEVENGTDNQEEIVSGSSVSDDTSDREVVVKD